MEMRKQLSKEEDSSKWLDESIIFTKNWNQIWFWTFPPISRNEIQIVLNLKILKSDIF